MINDEMEPKITSRDDHIDKEVDFDDIQKDVDLGNIPKEMDFDEIPKDEDSIEVDVDDATPKSSNKFKYLKKVSLGLLLAVIGMTILWVSFKPGEKGSITQNSGEMSPAAVLSKGDKPVEDSVKSEVKESFPEVIGSAPGQAERDTNAVTENLQPTPKVVDPVPQIERQDAAANLETTTPVVIAPKVKSTARVSKSSPEKKVAAAEVQKKQKEYKVIVGSFSAKANANSLIGKLKANHFEPMIVPVKTQKGRLYRVIAGSYRSSSIAKIKMGKLKSLGFKSFYIVE